MKDKFDKEELRSVMISLQDYIIRQTYDVEDARIEDIEMLDKVLDYLKELEGYYNG